MKNAAVHDWRGPICRGAILCTAAGLLAIASYRGPLWFETIHFGGASLAVGASAVLTMALAYAAVRASNAFVQRLTLEGATLGCALLVTELIITARSPGTWTDNAAARRVLLRDEAVMRRNLPLDTRTVSEVVADLREQGVDAVPGLARTWPTRLEVRDRLENDFYPLSHASGAVVVECNESGSYVVYETDEFGFNNPRGLIASGRIDVAVLGGSHAVGHCVPPDASFAALIRSAYSETANFSLAATNPVSQLATFREYIEPLRPRVTLWVSDPGMIEVAEGENSDLLMRYFDPRYSQRLMERQSEVDAAVRAIVPDAQAMADLGLSESLERARSHRFRAVPTLRELRSRLGIGPPRKADPAPDVSLFAAALRLVSATARTWNGEVFVVVLPDYNVFSGEAPEQLRYRSAIETVNSIGGITLIDLEAAFAAQDDPGALFTLRTQNHPNAAGHRLMAQHIVERLEPVLRRHHSATHSTPTRNGQ
jgi:hypothetical protein